jgi:hypothetical protein
MGPLISAGIGGQRRRLGRMLIANNLGDTNSRFNLNNVIHGAVGRLQDESGDNDVTFHICAGLAGGTGSGSVIDVLAQIRKQYPYQESTHAFKIRLFLYMPERVMVYSDHDSGFYQANGYADLRDEKRWGKVMKKPVISSWEITWQTYRKIDDLYYDHKIDVKEMPDLSDGKPMQYAELIMKHPEVHEEFLREEWMFED